MYWVFDVFALECSLIKDFIIFLSEYENVSNGQRLLCPVQFPAEGSVRPQ